MTSNSHYRREAKGFRAYGAILNDINAKLGYVIHLLREERGAYGPPKTATNGNEPENGNE